VITLTRRRRLSGGLATTILHNGKALTGAILLTMFTVIAIVPQWFTSINHPTQRAFELSLPPSSDHWLGTTAFGQDVLAQLIYGTRETLVIAFVVGALSTILSVIVGVSAAYLGGFADESLSLVTDVFLVIPTFPLIIVIAAYVGQGSLGVVIIVLTAYAMKGDETRAREAGCDDYISKPIDTRTLPGIIESHLHREVPTYS